MAKCCNSTFYHRMQYMGAAFNPPIYEPTAIEQDWINVQDTGSQIDILTVSHYSSDYVFLPTWVQVVKTDGVWSGPSAIVQVGIGQEIEALLPQSNLTNTQGLGKNIQQTYKRYITQGETVQLNVVQGASSASNPYVKVRLIGHWIQISVC